MGAILFVNTSNAYAENTSNLSAPITLPFGTNRYLVASISSYVSNPLDSANLISTAVSFEGTAMILVSSSAWIGTNSIIRSETWTLANPPFKDGYSFLSVTKSSTVVALNVGMVAVEEAQTSIAENSANTTLINTSGPTLAIIAISAGSWMFTNLVHSVPGITITEGSGQITTYSVGTTTSSYMSVIGSRRFITAAGATSGGYFTNSAGGLMAFTSCLIPKTPVAASTSTWTRFVPYTIFQGV